MHFVPEFPHMDLDSASLCGRSNDWGDRQSIHERFEVWRCLCVSERSERAGARIDTPPQQFTAIHYRFLALG